MTNALKIETFPYFFAIAKIRNPASINWKSPFVFVGKMSSVKRIIFRNDSGNFHGFTSKNT